jgi:hypothetical protein
MNIGGLRRPLERLEKVLKAQIEAALANAPEPELTLEQKERDRLANLQVFQLFPSFTAKEKAELERLSALHPEEENTYSLEDCMQEFDEPCQIENGLAVRMVP